MNCHTAFFRPKNSAPWPTPKMVGATPASKLNPSHTQPASRRRAGLAAASVAAVPPIMARRVSDIAFLSCLGAAASAGPSLSYRREHGRQAHDAFDHRLL